MSNAAKTLNATEKIIEGRDNAPTERETAVGNATLPTTEAPVAVFTLPGPVPNQKPSESVRTGAITKKDRVSHSFTTRSTTESILRLTVTPEQNRGYWESDLKIKPFSDPTSFQISFFELVERIRQRVSGVLVNVQTSYENEKGIVTHGKQVTKPGAMGLNLKTIAFDPNWSDADRRSIIDEANRLIGGNDDINEGPNVPANQSVKKYKKRHQFVGLKEEAELIKVSQTYAMTDLILVERVWQFRKEFDRREQILRQLPSEFMPQLNRYPFERLTSCYSYLMDRSPILRKAVIDAKYNWIQTNVGLDAKSSVDVYTLLAEIVGLKANTAKAINQLPREIEYSKGTDYFWKMLTVLTMSRWSQLAVDIVFDKFSIQTVLGCIFMKIMCPHHCMSPDSVLDIDNYLFYHLVPMLNGLDPNPLNYIRTIGSRDLRGNVNYLTRLFNNYNVLFASNVPLDNALRTFLHTDGRGGGWNMGNAAPSIPFKNKVVRFVPPERTLHYVPYFGADSESEAVDMPQMLNAIRFVNAVQFTKESASDQSSTVLRHLLVTILNIGAEARAYDMRIYTNNLLFKLCLLAGSYPTDPIGFHENTGLKRGEENNGSQAIKHTFHVSILGGISSLLNIDWSAYRQQAGIDFPMIENDWAQNQWFTQLVEMYHYTKDMYNKTDFPRLTSTDIYKLMVENMKMHITIEPVLFQEIGAKPHLYDLSSCMPPKSLINYVNRPRIKMYVQIAKWIKKKPELFGFVDHFYMHSKIDKVNFTVERPLYDVQYKTKEDAEIERVVSWDELRMMLTREDEFSILFDKIDDNKKVVKFDFPITYSGVEKEIDASKEDVETLPFTIETGGGGMINTLALPFRLNERNRRYRTNPFAMRWTPLFSSEKCLPYLPYDQIPLKDLIHTVEAWKEKTIVIFDSTDFEYVSVDG